MSELETNSHHHPNVADLLQKGDLTGAVGLLDKAHRLLKNCRDPRSVAARELLVGLGVDRPSRRERALEPLRRVLARLRQA